VVRAVLIWLLFAVGTVSGQEFNGVDVSGGTGAGTDVASFSDAVQGVDFSGASGAGTPTPGELGIVSVPDIGVDVGSLLGSAVETLGSVVAVAVGGFVAFLIVKRGLVWLGTALRP